MKQLNTGIKTLLGLIGGLAIWAMVMLGGGAMPAPIAYAATPQPQNNHFWLEYGLKQEQLWLTGQQDRLDLTRQYTANVQSLLNELSAQGKDTSKIQAALNTFNSQLEAAQSAHDQAKQILDAKAGFDANGKVTDPEQALETLQSARKSLEEARQILQQAAQDFRQAIQEFRQANRPNK